MSSLELESSRSSSHFQNTYRWEQHGSISLSAIETRIQSYFLVAERTFRFRLLVFPNSALAASSLSSFPPLFFPSNHVSLFSSTPSIFHPSSVIYPSI